MLRETDAPTPDEGTETEGDEGTGGDTGDTGTEETS